MISSPPSYDDELLNSAYANVSLIADKAWIFDKEDLFQKSNRSLWIQNCKLTARYKENSNQSKRVHNVIPNSRLAKYGNFAYNEEREKSYKQYDHASSISLSSFCWTEVTEPWMLPEVEEHFARIISSGTEANHREFSTVNESKSMEVLKTGSDFKTRWKDLLENQYARSNAPEKRTFDTNYEVYFVDKTNGNGSSTHLNIETDSCNYRRYSIENSAEMQLHIRITSDAVRNLWNPTKAHQQFSHQGIRVQCCHQQCPSRRETSYQGRERQQQFYYAFQYRPFILTTEYQNMRTETYGMTRKPLPPVLSPEVPEFFPKVPMARFNNNKEHNGNRIQYFPSLNERSYQNDLFPYARPLETVGIYQNIGLPMLQATDTTTFIRPPQQWLQRMPPPGQIQISTTSTAPICTTMQPLRTPTIPRHPLQVQEKYLRSTPIPVYQHPTEIYHESAQKRKNQGVDFKNLILLTKSAMKAHRSQTKNSQQRPSYVLESKNRNSRSKTEVLRWLDDKGPPAKTKEYEAVNALVSELQTIESKRESAGVSGSWNEIGDFPSTSEHLTADSGSSRSGNARGKTRRRLYRDVLANASSSDAVLENVYEKRYDELEQQAMEQYRNSEESLALKYQELERQAVEQYKCCGNSLEVKLSSSNVTEEDRRIIENSGTLEDRECIDGQRCSGFGRCNPVERVEKTQKGSFRQPQITLLKPEGKIGGNIPNRATKNARATIASKSLTKLAQKMSHGSKNTSKGASGDKIDKSVRCSSKRRLILMSPFERESEARLTKTTDLEEYYCISRTNKSLLNYYGNTKIGKTGGGDENIAIIRSPRTEGTSVKPISSFHR